MLAEVGRHLLKGLRHPALVRTTMALGVFPTRSPGVGQATTKAPARGEGMKARRIPLAVLLVISGIALADDGDAPQDQPARFKITTRRKDDGVEVKAEKGKTVFSVKSPFGISQAVIERQEDTWPQAVVLRLHLTGLSSFRASNGKVTLDAAVAIDDGKTQVRMWKGGKGDAPLDEKSPLWTIRIVGGDGSPARELPLKDGYFEMALPRAFFEGNPQSITLNWIDFYRG
jgi:hypothetical protein